MPLPVIDPGLVAAAATAATAASTATTKVRVDPDAGLVAAAIASGVAWLLVVAALALATRPRRPRPAPETDELGPQSPATVNFLVHRFRSTPLAAPATVLDLADRRLIQIEEYDPEHFVIRLRASREASGLTPYEARVLGHLQSVATGGVVPADALTTGPAAQSERWWRGLDREIVAEARQAGLCRPRWPKALVATLLLAGSVPVVCVWFAAHVGNNEQLAPTAALGIAALVAAVVIVTWFKIAGSTRQRDTPAGLSVTAHWLGVRDRLASNGALTDKPPAAIVLYGRAMAYGAAMGLARAAVAALPLGAEDDHDAWSTFGGRWRPVEVSYPRLRPGWGRHPGLAVFVGLVGTSCCAAPAYLLLRAGRPEATTNLRQSWIDIGWPIVSAVVALIAIWGLWWLAQLIRGIPDLWQRRPVEGTVVRMRTRKKLLGNNQKVRCYVAVDDGTRGHVAAWSVRPVLYARVVQRETVKALVTPRLRYVRVLSAPGSPADPAPPTPRRSARR